MKFPRGSFGNPVETQAARGPGGGPHQGSGSGMLILPRLSRNQRAPPQAPLAIKNPDTGLSLPMSLVAGQAPSRIRPGGWLPEAREPRNAVWTETGNGHGDPTGTPPAGMGQDSIQKLEVARTDRGPRRTATGHPPTHGRTLTHLAEAPQAAGGRQGERGGPPAKPGATAGRAGGWSPSHTAERQERTH